MLSPRRETANKKKKVTETKPDIKPAVGKKAGEASPSKAPAAQKKKSLAKVNKDPPKPAAPEPEKAPETAPEPAVEPAPVQPAVPEQVLLPQVSPLQPLAGIQVAQPEGRKKRARSTKRLTKTGASLT